MAPLSRPRFHHDWHWQWPYGNGELGHQGLHPLDLCRWGLDLPTICSSVLSWGGRFAHRDAAQTADTQVVLFGFGRESMVVETRSLPSPAYRDVQVGVIFEGTDGYVVLVNHDRGAAFDEAGREIRQFRGGGGSASHLSNFLHAVRRRSCRELHADIEEGHVTSALVHLANISYRLGRRMSLADARSHLSDDPGGMLAADAAARMQSHLRAHGVDPRVASLRVGARLVCDPAAETILNHAAANRMLTREYRSPYVVPAPGSV
jgi:predicted dehydrogenase